MTVFLPLDSGDDDLLPEERKVEARTFSGPDVPALYAMAVRDFDETRGLTVFGNAFGELALYDFSGSNHESISQCFAQIHFSDATNADRELLPLVRDSPLLKEYH